MYLSTLFVDSNEWRHSIQTSFQATHKERLIEMWLWGVFVQYHRVEDLEKLKSGLEIHPQGR